MSYIDDIVTGGIWPLRHHDKKFEPGMRVVRFACRVGGPDHGFGEGFDENGLIEGVSGNLNGGDEETYGDVQCAGMWPFNPGSPNNRGMPGWSFAWPSVVSSGGSKKGTQESDNFVFGSNSGGGGLLGSQSGDISIFGSGPKQSKTPGSDTKTQEKQKDASVEPIGIATVLPIYDSGGDGDSRFRPKKLRVANGFAKLPGGVHGVTVTGTKETNQEDIFMPSAPLVSVNFAGDHKCSSLVFDLNDKSDLDRARAAPLHSIMRVVRPQYNSLAWQLTKPGQSDNDGYGIVYGESSPGLTPNPATLTSGEVAVDVSGGSGGGVAAWDPRGALASSGGTFGGYTSGGPAKDTGGTGGVIAYAAVQKGGPLDVGSSSDVHSFGESKDGEGKNSLHLSTRSLFRGDGGDAPLLFEGAYEYPTSFPFKSYVHLQYDAADTHPWVKGARPGRWKWIAEVPGYKDTTPSRKGGGGGPTGGPGGGGDPGVDPGSGTDNGPVGLYDPGGTGYYTPNPPATGTTPVSNPSGASPLGISPLSPYAVPNGVDSNGLTIYVDGSSGGSTLGPTYVSPNSPATSPYLLDPNTTSGASVPTPGSVSDAFTPGNQTATPSPAPAPSNYVLTSPVNYSNYVYTSGGYTSGGYYDTYTGTSGGAYTGTTSGGGTSYIPPAAAYYYTYGQY